MTIVYEEKKHVKEYGVYAHISVHVIRSPTVEGGIVLKEK